MEEAVDEAEEEAIEDEKLHAQQHKDCKLGGGHVLQVIRHAQQHHIRGYESKPEHQQRLEDAPLLEELIVLLLILALDRCQVEDEAAQVLRVAHARGHRAKRRDRRQNVKHFVDLRHETRCDEEYQPCAQVGDRGRVEDHHRLLLASILQHQVLDHDVACKDEDSEPEHGGNGVGNDGFC